MQSETQLIEQAKTMEKAALNALITAYWPAVYRFALYKTQDEEEAKEIAQETFLRVLRALPSYDPNGAAFQTYLNRIATNLMTDRWRKKQRSPDCAELTEQTTPPSDEGLPDVQALRQEEREILLQTLQQLPEDQRKTIEYRIILGLSVKETAVVLQKSEAAVKMLQQRALKTCRALLINRGLLGPLPGGECLD